MGKSRRNDLVDRRSARMVGCLRFWIVLATTPDIEGFRAMWIVSLFDRILRPWIMAETSVVEVPLCVYREDNKFANEGPIANIRSQPNRSVERWTARVQ